MKVDRRSTKHLSTGQLNLIRKALNKVAFDHGHHERELKYQASRYGLRTETLREIVYFGHTEVTPRR